jgi:hypothetical protein
MPMEYKNQKIKKPMYETWKSIKKRCYNPNNKDYKWYGAKGVKMSDLWLYDYKAFELWGISSGWKPGLVISRNNDEGDYSPDNCSIRTSSENSKEVKITNTKRNITSKPVINIKTGIKYPSIIEASKHSGLSSITISKHINGKIKNPKWKHIKED